MADAKTGGPWKEKGKDFMESEGIQGKEGLYKMFEIWQTTHKTQKSMV